MGFSENLRFLRRKNKYSQEYLAEKLGYKSYTTIQKWEMGTSEPDLNTIKQLAGIFNVSMNDLVNEDVSSPDFLSNKAQDDVAMWMGKLLKSKDKTTFNFLKKISRLNEEDISFLDSVADSLLSKKKKD